MILCPSVFKDLPCDLPADHEGYHWHGDVIPWPDNERIAIRAPGAFCTGKKNGKDCQLKWLHPGPHARPGMIWA